MNDITRLKKGRKVIEEHRQRHSRIHQDKNKSHGAIEQEHEELVMIMKYGMLSVGFKSIDEFEKFNKEICYNEFKRCYKRVSDCDGCEDRERGCLTSCYEGFSKEYTGKLSADLADKERRQVYIDATPSAFDTDQVMYWKLHKGFVPHNCSVKFEKINEPKFDIRWDLNNIGKYIIIE